MELVYLWVEDYKNIHEQGFNFSPKFTCDYDGKELTITENDDYIENFFGKNINVTAIVGKNGSGKSSVLKFIRQIIDQKIDDGSFLIFYDKEKEQFICIYTLTKINLKNIEMIQEEIMDSHIHFPLFDYSLTYDSSINFQKEQLPVYPKKLNGFLNFHRELIANQKNIMYNFIHLKKKKLLNRFEDFFQPSEIKIIFDLEKLKPHKDEELIDEKQVLYEKLKDDFQKNTSIENALELIEQLINLLASSESYKKKEEIFETVELLPTLEKELRRLEGENSELNEIYFSENIWEEKEKRELLHIKNKFNYIPKDENKYCLFTFDVNESLNDIINIILDSFPLSYFQIELMDNGKKLSNLSFGEQQLLCILNQIYTLGVKTDEDLYDKIDQEEIIEQGHNIHEVPRYYKINYIILFDEIDIGFHPDWQKRTIQYIIDFLNSTDDEKYYHLIFATHSPFLLSDIPKENIIFLGDNSPNTQTFGANIHTLLSDSFFMEDGLMGEFAKNKIQEIMDFLNDIKTIKEISTKEEQIKQVIESIGEPFLKQKLLDMYYKKFKNKASKRARKDELLAEQKRIEIELKKYD